MDAARVIGTVKGITAREVLGRCPQAKKKLWGGQFWSDGYYVKTVGMHGKEKTVGEYVRGQGKEGEYKQLLCLCSN